MIPIAFAEILAELLHYNYNLAVFEGVLGPIALGKGAMLYLQELCSTVHSTCPQNILRYHWIVKEYILVYLVWLKNEYKGYCTHEKGLKFHFFSQELLVA